MQEEEYTFVTLDGNDVMPADAVIIDVEGGGVDLMMPLWSMRPAKSY